LGITYTTFTTLSIPLRQSGLLTSVQGRNGGFKLGKPVSEISFYDVFLCFEQELCISQTLKDGQAHKGKMRTFLQSWQDSMIRKMSNQSIEDLVS
jgi:Rrf2 family protein